MSVHWKVGDTLICVDNENAEHNLNLGSEYPISSFWARGEPRVLVRDKELGYMANRFKLKTPAKDTVQYRDETSDSEDVTMELLLSKDLDGILLRFIGRRDGDVIGSSSFNLDRDTAIDLAKELLAFSQKI